MWAGGADGNAICATTVFLLTDEQNQTTREVADIPGGSRIEKRLNALNEKRGGNSRRIGPHNHSSSEIKRGQEGAANFPGPFSLLMWNAVWTVPF